MFYFIFACNKKEMYQAFLFSHTITRWFVLASLLFALYRAWQGYRSKLPFTKTDNSIRHWTATIAHAQLVLGMVLYFKSPFVQYFRDNQEAAIKEFDIFFFSVIHSSLMLIAIVLITIGSARSKRQHTDQEKFKTMLIWFSLALMIILMAIPWPFSPLASRPYLR